MAGTEGYVRVPADSTGKKLRTVYDTVGADEVHNEGVVICDPTTVTQVAGVDASSQLKVVEASASAIKTAVETIDNAIAGTEMQVDVVAALPAGANAIGKLAANSGVDIGDVDVTSVVPGTAASNLGKAEDAAHASGDTGVAALSVRQDSAAALSGTDGDYQPLITDASGRLHVAPLATGSNAIGKLAANSGVDIGDVDVTSVVPGTAASNLGKAEDAAHSSGDTGVMALAVRDDAPPAVVSGAAGDYEPLHTDGKGQVYAEVHQGVTYDLATFDAAASGNLVAATASYVNKLHGLTIQAQGTVTVNLTDGAGGSSLMEWDFEDREGAVIGFAPFPARWLQTSVNTALYVQLSAAVTVTMNAIYSNEHAT